MGMRWKLGDGGGKPDSRTSDALFWCAFARRAFFPFFPSFFSTAFIALLWSCELFWARSFPRFPVGSTKYMCLRALSAREPSLPSFLPVVTVVTHEGSALSFSLVISIRLLFLTIFYHFTISVFCCPPRSFHYCDFGDTCLLGSFPSFLTQFLLCWYLPRLPTPHVAPYLGPSFPFPGSSVNGSVPGNSILSPQPGTTLMHPPLSSFGVCR